MLEEIFNFYIYIFVLITTTNFTLSLLQIGLVFFLPILFLGSIYVVYSNIYYNNREF